MHEMNINTTGLTVFLLFCLVLCAQSFNLQLDQGLWSVNTCNCSSNFHPRHSLRACKLVSMKSTISDTLEHIKDLKRELEARHNRSLEEEAVPNATNSEVELFHTSYRTLQDFTLDVLILEQYQRAVRFIYPSCEVLRNFRRMLCHIRPVLEMGAFEETSEVPDCVITRDFYAPDRTEIINFAESIVLNATSTFTWMASSISLILTEL